MGKPKVKPNYRRRLLRLPDLDNCKRAVLNSLCSPTSRRVYEFAKSPGFNSCECRANSAFSFSVFRRSENIRLENFEWFIAAIRRAKRLTIFVGPAIRALKDRL